MEVDSLSDGQLTLGYRISQENSDIKVCLFAVYDEKLHEKARLHS